MHIRVGHPLRLLQHRRELPYNTYHYLLLVGFQCCSISTITCYIHHYHRLHIYPFQHSEIPLPRHLTMTIPSASNSAAEIVEVRPKVLSSKIAQDLKPASNIDIIDIRHDAVELNLKDEIMASLRPQSGPKTMPTLLLYDERGLQLFEEVSLIIRIEPLDGRAEYRTDHVFARILPYERRNRCPQTICRQHCRGLASWRSSHRAG